MRRKSYTAKIRKKRALKRSYFRRPLLGTKGRIPSDY